MLDRFPVAQTDRPLRQTRHIGIMRDQHKRSPRAAIQLEHDLDDPCARLRVEVPRRLVGEKNLRPVDESTGERDPLLFAAGKLRRIMIDPLRESDALEQIQAEIARACDRLATPLEPSHSPAPSASE